LAKEIANAPRPARIDPHVAAVRPARCLQLLHKARKADLPIGSAAARFMSMPTRRIRSPCCARAASGNAAAAPESSAMNSRRFMGFPTSRITDRV